MWQKRGDFVTTYNPLKSYVHPAALISPFQWRWTGQSYDSPCSCYLQYQRICNCFSNRLCWEAPYPTYVMYVIATSTAQNGVVVKISDSSKRPTAPDRQHKRASMTRDTVGWRFQPIATNTDNVAFRRWRWRDLVTTTRDGTFPGMRGDAKYAAKYSGITPRLFTRGLLHASIGFFKVR